MKIYTIKGLRFSEPDNFFWLPPAQWDVNGKAVRDILSIRFNPTAKVWISQVAGIYPGVSRDLSMCVDNTLLFIRRKKVLAFHEGYFRHYAEYGESLLLPQEATARLKFWADQVQDGVCVRRINMNVTVARQARK